MALVAKIRDNEGCVYRMTDQVAENDMAAVDGDLMSLDGGFAQKATAGNIIEGVIKQTKTFDSDNETVAKEKVTYVPNQDNITLEMVCDDTITLADQGKWFNINAAQTVDVATGTLTKTSALNLKLVKYISATKGLFVIDNDQV